MKDTCPQKTAENAAVTREASGLSVYLIEELGDARAQFSKVKKYLDDALHLVEKSDQKDHFYEVASHLINGIPEALDRTETALNAAALAASRLDYEDLKQSLSPEKVDALEEALDNIRVRRLQREKKEARGVPPPLPPEALRKRDTDVKNLSVHVKAMSAFNQYVRPKIKYEVAYALQTHMEAVLKEFEKMRRGGRSSFFTSKFDRIKPEQVSMGVWLDRVEEALEAWYSALQGTIRKASIMKAKEAADRLEAFASLAEKTGSVDAMALAEFVGMLEAGSSRTASDGEALANSFRMLASTLREGGEEAPSPDLVANVLRRVMAETMELPEMEKSASRMGTPLSGLDVEADEGDPETFYLFDDSGRAWGPEFKSEAEAERYLAKLRGMLKKNTKAVIKRASEMEKAAKYQDVKIRNKPHGSGVSSDDFMEAMKQAAENYYSCRGTNRKAHQALEDALTGYMARIGPLAGMDAALYERAQKCKKEMYELDHAMGRAAGSLEVVARDMKKVKTASDVSEEDQLGDEEDTTEARYEEGKPADPTKNMTPEDAKKWKENVDYDGSNIKEAASGVLMKRDVLRAVKKLSLMDEVQVRGSGARWEIETSLDVNSREIRGLEKSLGVTLGGYQTGYGAWVLKPNYKSMGDWNDPSSKHHYASQDDEKEARYEEGKPADPTENMTPEDAKKWKENVDEDGSNLKAAAKKQMKSQDFEKGQLVRPNAQYLRSMGGRSGIINGKVVGFNHRTNWVEVLWNNRDEPVMVAAAAIEPDPRYKGKKFATVSEDPWKA